MSYLLLMSAVLPTSSEFFRYKKLNEYGCSQFSISRTMEHITNEAWLLEHIICGSLYTLGGMVALFLIAVILGAGIVVFEYWFRKPSLRQIYPKLSKRDEDLFEYYCPKEIIRLLRHPALQVSDNTINDYLVIAQKVDDLRQRIHMGGDPRLAKSDTWLLCSECTDDQLRALGVLDLKFAIKIVKKNKKCQIAQQLLKKKEE